MRLLLYGFLFFVLYLLYKGVKIFFAFQHYRENITNMYNKQQQQAKQKAQTKNDIKSTFTKSEPKTSSRYDNVEEADFIEIRERIDKKE